MRDPRKFLLLFKTLPLFLKTETRDKIFLCDKTMKTTVVQMRMATSYFVFEMKCAGQKKPVVVNHFPN